MRKSILAIIAAAGLIATGAAITFAATSSSSLIQACVNNKTHVLSLQTGRGCPTGTTGISWNRRGPAGPSTAGPTGLDVRWISARKTSTGGTGSANAQCPASHPYLVGGGVGSTGIVQQSGPSGFMSGHPGWGVTVKASKPSNADVYAFAACAK